MTTEITYKIPQADVKAFEQLHALAHKEAGVKRVALVASKGTLDMAYPTLILASTAAAMGMECGVFFTFYGLDIINRKKYRSLKVAPLANPAAPLPVPNLLGAIPGATWLATRMMKYLMGRQNMPPLTELLDTCRSLGVTLFGCSTTMGVMGVKQEDLVDGVDIAGAAAFLEYASQAQVTLFI